MDGATGLAGEKQKENAESLRMSDRAILVGVVINIVLSVAKILTGITASSAALLADGVHSLSDLLSDAAVWISNRMSREAPDAGHPYGHGRYETLSVLFIGLLMLGVAVGIVVDAIERVQVHQVSTPKMEAMIVVILSILSKEWLFHYTRKVGETYHLRAMIANAWHHRSDSISSIAAMVGIFGAMMGWPVMDPISAIVVSIILIKMAFSFLRDAYLEFTDSAAAIDNAIQDKILHMIEEYPDIHSAHLLKARRSGPHIYVDVHAVVNPFLSVSEGHQIAEKVRLAIIDGVLEVTDVLVHVDPADDQNRPMPINYPNRQKLRQTFTPLLKQEDGLMEITDLVLHYTYDGIVADMVIAVDFNRSLPELRTAALHLCQNILKSNERISNVRLKTVIHGCDRGWS